MKFLKTHWENLIMVNYEIDAELSSQYVPAGCELDIYDGKALISVVAFVFRKTRILGMAIPIYKEFPEINLRIYVKRIEGGEWHRGVVYIKEIIPHRWPAWIAKTVFKENFQVVGANIEHEGQYITYRWGEDNFIGGRIKDRLNDWVEGTEEELIGDNFFAFKRVNQCKTLEFEVTHEAWKMCKLDDVELKLDFEQLLWQRIFARAIVCCGGEPSTLFFVEGNEVEVTLPRKI